jgi:hypothetical protein
MGELFGAAVGTFLIGGLFGWLVHKLTGQPFAIADAVGLAGVVTLGGLSNATGGTSWLLYALVSFPAYFVLQRLRGHERGAVVMKTEPSLPKIEEYPPLANSELAAQIALEEDIAQSVREQFQAVEERTSHRAGQSLTPPSRNFFVRHWRGELSLAVSYWAINFCAFIASTVAVAVINVTLVPSRGYEPSLLLAVNILTWLALAVILVWQVVGLWRSARRRAIELGKLRRSAFWPLAAQFAAVLGVLQFAATFSATGAPSLTELSRIVFQNDPDIPNAMVTIADGGRTLKIEGGIKYGLSRNVETVLDAAPTVTALQLDSLGGRVAEATKLFDLVRSRHLDTFVSGECSSACTLVFAAGNNRFLDASGILGFHSSYWPGATAADIRDMNAMWAATYRSVGISAAFLARAMSTSSSQMWYPTHEELRQSGVLSGDIASVRHVPEGFSPSGSTESVRQSFLALGTLYEAIDVFAPNAASKIYEAGSQYERGMITAESMRSIISQQIAITVAARVPTSDDETLVEYASLVAEQYGHLQQTDPDACFRYAAGDPTFDISAHLTPELVQRENAFSERVIRSPITPRAASGNLDPTWDLISSIMLATVSEQQMAVFALPIESVRPADYPSYCFAAQAMMDAISRLSPRQAGAIVRFLFA